METGKKRFVFFFPRESCFPNKNDFRLLKSFSLDQKNNVPLRHRFHSNSLAVILQALVKRLFQDEVEIIGLSHPVSLSWEIPLREFEAVKLCPFILNLSGDKFCRENPGRLCPFFHPKESFDLRCDFLSRMQFVAYNEFNFKKGDNFYIIVSQRDEYRRPYYDPRLWLCLSDCHL